MDSKYWYPASKPKRNRQRPTSGLPFHLLRPISWVETVHQRFGNGLLIGDILARMIAIPICQHCATCGSKWATNGSASFWHWPNDGPDMVINWLNAGSLYRFDNGLLIGVLLGQSLYASNVPLLCHCRPTYGSTKGLHRFGISPAMDQKCRWIGWMLAVCSGFASFCSSAIFWPIVWTPELGVFWAKDGPALGMHCV